MTVPRKRTFAWLFVLALLAGSAGSVWRVKAQSGTGKQPVSVQALAGPIQPAPVTAGDRGATYHALEGQATRVTTRFADAIATADRAPDGHMSTRLTDLAGNEVATFRVHHVDAGSDSLEFALPDRTPMHAARRPGVRPTLDWSNQQAYSLWKDRGAIGRAALEWQDTLMRPVGAEKRDVNADALQTDTAWLGGFSASVIRKIGTHISYLNGRQSTGIVYISSLKKDGVEVGYSQWWPQEQAFAWSFPGLTQGYVDSTRLQRIGGWSFAPDMAWMNTQNLALHQFHTLVNTRGSVSERRGGWIERVGAFIVPKLLANEAGCDDLHWLDQSIFRPCCDTHDLCYAKQSPACTSSSWWMWWTSWQCDVCNITAVVCFMTGGGHTLNRFP